MGIGGGGDGEKYCGDAEMYFQFSPQTVTSYGASLWREYREDLRWIIANMRGRNHVAVELDQQRKMAAIVGGDAAHHKSPFCEIFDRHLIARRASDLPTAVSSVAPGSTEPIQIWRAGSETDLTVRF
jgi:hypothetical protein